MNKDNPKLSITERWEIDKKIGATFEIFYPQCDICMYAIKNEAIKCLKYKSKPNYIRSCSKECQVFRHKEELKLDFNDNKQIYGGIFGFCIGDALGVPLEFESREILRNDPIKEMRAYGTHHQYFGTWSDDSSMAFCLMDSLKEGYNLNDLADKFCKFYYESYWTPYNEVFDIGNTTVQAIERMKAGINPIECGGKSENDNGNGSLMRILPLAIYLQDKRIKEKIQVIEDVSSLTHAHKRSKLACIIYIELAINLLQGLSKQESYQKAQEFILFNCNENYKEEFINFDKFIKNDISSLKENEVRSSGYVIDSLEAAVWSFLSSQSYAETILKAINLGGDTDTIAAIAGGLAGIFYGIDSIPENWIQCLARKKDIYILCKDFLDVIRLECNTKYRT